MPRGPRGLQGQPCPQHPPSLPAAPHQHLAKPGMPTGAPGLCRCILPPGSVCLGQGTRAPCCVHGGDDASLGAVLQVVRFLGSKPCGCRDAPFGRLFRAVESVSWKGPATIVSSNCHRQVCSLRSRNGRCSVLGSGGVLGRFRSLGRGLPGKAPDPLILAVPPVCYVKPMHPLCFLTLYAGGRR